MSRDKVIVLDILRAARLSTEFLGGTDKPDFLKDVKTQSAVLHQLLLIGEAVKRLSEEFRGRSRGNCRREQRRLAVLYHREQD